MALPKTPTMSLAGKRAVVTGASSGIGLAAAVALGEAGADVMLVARRAAPLQDLASAMQQA
ncbi:MAG: SDR family NAD(P)-dependent oxidoreductase, partial [Candidatus Puniceispirillum sp.]